MAPENLPPAQQSIIDCLSKVDNHAAAIEALADQLPKIPTTRGELVALREATVAQSKVWCDKQKCRINIGLDYLQHRLDERLLSFQKNNVGAVADMVGDVVRGAGDLAGKGISASVEQVGNSFETAKQVVYNEAEAFSKKSGWERAQQVGGLTALAILVGYPIYKLAEKISHAGVKEGEKPGFFRKLLKYTGILALSTAAVHFLGPRVLAAQSPDATKSQTQPSENLAISSVENKEDFLGRYFTFNGTKMSVVKSKGQKLLQVGENQFSVRWLGNNLWERSQSFAAGNVNNYIIDIQLEQDGLRIQYRAFAGFLSGDVTLSRKHCTSIANTLSDDKKHSLFLTVVRNGIPEEMTLEFTPETTS